MQIGADGRIYVPAKIKDTPRSMLVDTGGFFTEITEPVAEQLKLSARHTRLRLIGIAGDTTGLAVTTSFTLGSLHADNMDFMVMPSVHRFAPDVPEAAGLLAPNLLRAYDVDFDFTGKKLNLISQKHCQGKVIYWPADAVAVIPVQINSSGHILMPVELDGHRLSAMLDTGASISVLNLNTAQSTLGVSPGSDETPPSGNVVGVQTYRHRFRSLALEGITISNPELRLVPDLMRAKMTNPHDSLEGDTRIPSTKTEIGLGQMILGMDVLHRMHVYIAYKEQRLYLTPASPSAAALASPTAPSAAAGVAK
jgi:predicted aspartyl protease